MQKYIEDIPLEIRNAIKALCSETRQAILGFLLNEGAKSFTEISKNLKISKSKLNHHLKTLMRYGMIYNFYNKNEFKDKYSFYETSKLGKTIINNLINSITPLTFRKSEKISIDDTNVFMTIKYDELPALRGLDNIEYEWVVEVIDTADKVFSEPITINIGKNLAQDVGELY